MRQSTNSQIPGDGRLANTLPSTSSRPNLFGLPNRSQTCLQRVAGVCLNRSAMDSQTTFGTQIQSNRVRMPTFSVGAPASTGLRFCPSRHLASAGAGATASVPKSGGSEGLRTLDLILTKDAFCQLNYRATNWSRRSASNRQPLPYRGSAPPTCATPAKSHRENATKERLTAWLPVPRSMGLSGSLDPARYWRPLFTAASRELWSSGPGSNRRPLPYEGSALPTMLPEQFFDESRGLALRVARRDIARPDHHEAPSTLSSGP